MYILQCGTISDYNYTYVANAWIVMYVWYCSKITLHLLACLKLPLACSMLFVLCTSLALFLLSFTERSTECDTKWSSQVSIIRLIHHDVKDIMYQT